MKTRNKIAGLVLIAGIGLAGQSLATPYTPENSRYKTGISNKSKEALIQKDKINDKFKDYLTATFLASAVGLGYLSSKMMKE